MGFKMKNEKDMTGAMKATAEVLNGTSVSVGCDWANAWLAAIHEYGCTIPVTDKMRAYLHHIGVHLKASTTQIVIPERSFLRAGYDQYRDEVLDLAESVMPDVLAGTMSEQQYFELVGTLLRDRIKEYAVDLSEPPKKPFPTSDPNKMNPLIQTGNMINSLEYEVET